MPKIIPLGEIDPVLYGIAKRRATMMEQGTMSFVGAFENELGRIIFKRVGQVVHAIVDPAGFFVSNLVGYLEPDRPRNYSQLGGTPVSFDWGAYGFMANEVPLLVTTPSGQREACVAHTSTGWIGFSQDEYDYPYVLEMHWGEIGDASEVHTLDLTPNREGFSFPPGVPLMRAEFDRLSASIGNFGSAAALVQWMHKDTRTSIPPGGTDEYDCAVILHVLRDGQRTEHTLSRVFGVSTYGETSIPATHTGTMYDVLPACCANRSGDVFVSALEIAPKPPFGWTGSEQATMRLWHESGGTITDLSHLVADPDPALRFKVVPNAWDGPILAVCIVYKPDVIPGNSLIPTRLITLRRVDGEIVGTTCTAPFTDTLPAAATHAGHMLCGPTLYLSNQTGGNTPAAVDTQTGVYTGNTGPGGVGVRFATNGRRTYIVGRDEAKLISPALFQQGVTTPTLPPAPDAAVFIRTKTR